MADELDEVDEDADEVDVAEDALEVVVELVEDDVLGEVEVTDATVLLVVGLVVLEDLDNAP